MKQKLLFVWVMFLTLVFSFNSIAAETEPNNVYTQASFLSLNGSDNGSFTKSVDNIDWWKVTVTQNGKLLVALQNNTDGTINMRLYDSNGSSYFQTRDISSGASNTVEYSHFLPGTYYLYVYSYSGTGNYTISNTFTLPALTTDTEPNDDANNANTLQLDIPVTGNVGYSGNGIRDEADWWKVTIPKNGKLSVTCTRHESSESTISFRLYNADKTSLLESRDVSSSTNVQTITETHLTPGTYYVKLDPYSPYMAIYTLSATFTHAEVETDTEPNNTADEAIVLPLDTEKTGHIGFSGSEEIDTYDWWKVSVDKDGMLEVNLQNLSSSEGTVNLRLYNANKTEYFDSKDAQRETDNTVRFTHLTPGTYYVYIYTYGGMAVYKLNATHTQPPAPTDTEPNDTPDEANELLLETIETGHVGYRGELEQDQVDWWKVTTPADGTLSVTLGNYPQSEQTLSFRIYNANKTDYLETADVQIGVTKTLSNPRLAPGTYYVRIEPYSTTNAVYSITADFTEPAWTIDSEPNDVASDAVEIALNSSATGHIGYQGSQERDTYDWWKVTTVEDGKLEVTLSNHETSEETMAMRLYAPNGETYYDYCDISIGNTDAVEHTHLTPGTYYIRLYAYSTNASTYSITTDFTPAPVAIDSEPNDVASDAATIALNGSATGHIGYSGSQPRDVYDWWKVTTEENGKLEVTLSSHETSEVTMALRLYAPNGYNYYDSKDISTGNTGSVEHRYLTPGTYYIWVYGYSNESAIYSITTDFTIPSVAVDSEPNNVKSDAVAINFDENYTGHLGYTGSTPKDEYDWYKIETPKGGVIEMIMHNLPESESSMNTRVYDEEDIQLLSKDISSGENIYTFSTPFVETGTYYVRLYRYGNYQAVYSFNCRFIPAPEAKFEFSQTLSTFAFTDKSTYNPVEYSWDFGDGATSTKVNPQHTYTAPGEYEVCLTVSNDIGETTYCDYMVIEGIRQVETRKAGNTGDVTFSVYGGGFDENTTFKFTKDGYTNLTADNVTLIDRGVLQGTFDMRGVAEGTWNVVVEVTGQAAMQMDNAMEVVTGTPADPWVEVNGRGKILFGRWQTYTITLGNNGNVDAHGVPLWITFSQDAEIEFKDVVFDMVTESQDSKYDGIKEEIPLYFDVDSVFGEPIPSRVYPLYVPVIPAGQTVTAQIRLKSEGNISLKVWINPPYFQSPMNRQLADCIRNAQIRGVLGAIPGVDCLYSGMSIFYDPFEAPLPENDKPKTWGSRLWNTAGSVFSAAWTCGSDMLPIGAVGKLVVKASSFAMDSYGNYSAIKECEDAFKNKSAKEKDIRAVSSFDPNEIVGPEGYGDNNYILRQNEMAYTIFFENKNTATAPAQEVFVTDMLDLDVFDVEDFSFGKITFGSHTIQPPLNIDEFTTDVDLRPEKNTIVRITATLNKETGELKWSFVSLDPETMILTEDPDGGFLPPNVTSPEGEGSVSFLIGIKDEIGDGDMIKNKATIVFDLNEPIVTNEYINVFDELAPLSNIDAIPATSEVVDIPLSWDGNDTGAGVRTYSIYVSSGDSTYLWLGNTNKTEAVFTGLHGSNYGFNIVAADSLGNTEPLRTTFDAQISIENETSGIENAKLNFAAKVYPNPFDNKLNIAGKNPTTGDIRVQLMNISGQVISDKLFNAVPAGDFNLEIYTNNRPAGIYIVKITVAAGVAVRRIYKK